MKGQVAMGIVGEFSESPMNNRFEVITGSAVGIPLPDQPCLLLRIQARAGNISPFYVGASPSTCTYEISAGTDIGWIPARNLSQLFVRCPSGSSNYLSVWWQI